MAQGTAENPKVQGVPPVTTFGPADLIHGPKADGIAYLDWVKQNVGDVKYEQFWGRFLHTAVCELHLVLNKGRGRTSHKGPLSPTDHDDLLRDLRKQTDGFVLVVSNINEQWINILGPALNLDPAFLAQHLARHQILDSNGTVLPDETAIPEWQSRIQRSDIPGQLDMSWGFRNKKIAGFYRCNISCCRLRPHEWVFLVSEPVWPPNYDQTSPFELDLSFDSYWRPLTLPSSLSDRNSFQLSEILLKLLHEVDNRSMKAKKARKLLRWALLEDHFSTKRLKNLFQALQMLMAVTAWQSNIGHLESRLSNLQLRAISNPTMHTFLPLTTLRRNLTDLRNGLSAARFGIAPGDYDGLHCIGEGENRKTDSWDVLDELVERTDHLAEALGREIQLIIGSVQVRDSDNMKRQSDRTLLLTLLAALYLPMTLVTGIFGMNISEINGGTPKYWACLGTFGVTFIVTVVLFFGVYFLRDRHRKSENAIAAKSAEEGYKLA